MKIKKLFGLTAVAGVCLLASCNGGGEDTTSNTTTQTAIVEKNAMSYEEYIAAAVEEEVCIQATIQDRCTWYNNAASFYLADEDGGYYVYNMPCTEEEYKDLKPGIEIKVTGAKAEWKGEVEISFNTPTENSGWEIVSYESSIYSAATVENISKAELDKYKNLKVEANALTVTKAPYTNHEDFSLATGAGVDVYFGVKDNFGNEATYVVEAYLEDTQSDSDVYKTISALKVGDVIDLEGFVYYWENPQLQVTKVTEIDSYEEYLAKAVDEETTIQAYITARTSWYNNAASFYLADEDGGYYAYNIPCPEVAYNNSLKVGAFVEITGAKAEWKGEVEINGGQATENQNLKVLSGTKTFDAVKVDDIAVDTLNQYKNQKVAVEGLTVTKAAYTNHEDFTLATGAGVDVYFTVKDANDNELTFVLEAYLEGCFFESETYTAVAGLKVGDKVNLEGFVYYWENPQLQVTACTIVE